MDFSADFQPYKKGVHLQGVMEGAVLMDFTAEFASCRRRRRTTTGSSCSRRASLSQSPPPLFSSTWARRWLVLFFLFLLFLFAVSLLPGDSLVARLDPRQTIFSLQAENSYQSLVDESQFSPYNSKYSKQGTDEVIRGGEGAHNTEAVKSLAAAQEMNKLGKVEKASRLFAHALALAPKNPLILLHYGEFLQEQVDDLVQADHYFARALAFCPASDIELRSRATARRQVTQTKVQSLDESVLKRIDVKKIKFLEVRADSAALKRAKEEAYYQYIYHTVGIEGNTMSLAQTRSILETKLAVAGKSIMEHNEILGMDAALKYINNTLVDKLGDITLEDILEIHRRVIGNVDPIEAGLFRRTQVWVGDHVPPPPSLLNMLAHKFVAWLNTEVHSSRLHPVRLAALAHYKLVYIHPFVDGNGRTSRLLMNLVLMQAGYPPVIIRRSDRETYYRHLVTANEGDVRPFVRFIAHCTEKTLDAYLWATQEWTGELEMDVQGANLPANLLENSIEQVNSELLGRRREMKDQWLNLAGEEKIIVAQSEEDNVIRMEGVV